MTGTEIKQANSLARIVADYTHKFEQAEENIKEYEALTKRFEMNCLVLGTYSDVRVLDGRFGPSLNRLQESLLKSAWRCVHDQLQIERIASAEDKLRLKMLFENPPTFCPEELKKAFGGYIEDPRQNILRGLAEVFTRLDDAYKSHSKVKIGVEGLPKRVIISYVTSHYGYGYDKIVDVLNALARYQGKPLVEREEMNELLTESDSLVNGFTYKKYSGDEVQGPDRGVWLKRFKNGNAHLYFSPDTLKDVNRALAEYYGDVLPDCHDDGEEKKKEQSTAVAKDLQYYPTPKDVAERLVDGYVRSGKQCLEPSCGDGRIMEAIKRAGGVPFGVECDYSRAQEAKNKGFRVLCANFLETTSFYEYDLVFMNPPFYGKHYAKHVNHALKFLKSGGTLRAILPATARYDHDLLKGQWEDLPVGSFSESGTNVCTVILTIRKD